jgi:hypothetical protein
VNIVLANIDYLNHTSSEGFELQTGLREAGWALVGPGFDGERNVTRLLDRYQPECVFVQDCRDWLAESNISFRKDISFTNMEALGEAKIPAFTVLKDAWGWKDLQSRLAHQIKAAGLLCYYRLELIREVAPWTKAYKLLRFHHTVDTAIIRRVLKGRTAPRQNALVSGMLQGCYPLRQHAFAHAKELGLDVIPHPGYGNRGMDTPNYLAHLAGYKVHLATASQWGCAFRKIIESVACGCTPITNLPASDMLPEIDGALVRIPSTISTEALAVTIKQAVKGWDAEERRIWSDKALVYYDWRVSGQRHAQLMEPSYVPSQAVGSH